jgi:hypothetical protein
LCHISAPSHPLPNGIPSSHRLDSVSNFKLCWGFGCAAAPMKEKIEIMKNES